mmetsp:Transcript_38423/g.124035  ORF Transcript_38423/g.124035 Transcript_38423/m.124035 type:complete len:212 (+) Transcript_38423:35-670(+)
MRRPRRRSSSSIRRAAASASPAAVRTRMARWCRRVAPSASRSRSSCVRCCRTSHAAPSACTSRSRRSPRWCSTARRFPSPSTTWAAPKVASRPSMTRASHRRCSRTCCGAATRRCSRTGRPALGRRTRWDRARARAACPASSRCRSSRSLSGCRPAPLRARALFKSTRTRCTTCWRRRRRTASCPGCTSSGTARAGASPPRAASSSSPPPT